MPRPTISRSHLIEKRPGTLSAPGPVFLWPWQGRCPTVSRGFHQQDVRSAHHLDPAAGRQRRVAAHRPDGVVQMHQLIPGADLVQQGQLAGPCGFASRSLMGAAASSPERSRRCCQRHQAQVVSRDCRAKSSNCACQPKGQTSSKSPTSRAAMRSRAESPPTPSPRWPAARSRAPASAVGQPLEQGCHEFARLAVFVEQLGHAATKAYQAARFQGHRMMILLLGPSPMRARASVYFWATK